MKNLVFLSFLFAAGRLPADDLTKPAADFICEAEKKNKLTRLAVFTITDADGEETDESAAQSTELLSALATCENLTLIDKSKEEDILEQQAFAQTGIVDEKTMVPAGQLIGADSLLFGIARDGSLEVRILDAKTGRLLGAQIFTDSGEVQAVTNTEDDYYTKRWLVDSVQTQPPVYLYVTSSPGDWNILCARYPYLERYYNSLSGDQQRQLNGWRERVDKMRRNNRLPQSHNRQFRHDALVHGREHVREQRINNPRRFHMRTGERYIRRQGSGERYHNRSAQFGRQQNGNSGHHGMQGGHQRQQGTPGGHHGGTSGGHHGGSHGGHGGHR
jgi:hypothetical protein